MPNIFKSSFKKRAEAAEAIREDEAQSRGAISTVASVYGVAHIVQDYKNEKPAAQISLSSEEGKSPCWKAAEDIFRRKIKEGRRSIDDSVITDFLHSQGSSLEKTIDICDSFKKKAENEYHRSDGKSNIAGKLLKTLTTVKEIGDPFLQYAPESVSIAWWAVTSIVQVAMKDMEKCEMVAGASESLVTIILNCRLFEKRYATKATGGGDHDTEQRILDKIPEVIAGVLNFAWYTKREFFGEGQGKLERIFKTSFSTTLKGLIDGILDDYKKLRVDTGDAFESRVMDQLETIYKETGKNLDNMKELLFPELNDIKNLIQDVIDNEKKKAEAEEAQDAFKTRREAFNPNNHHKKQLEAILSPFKEEFNHKEISTWFFNGETYQAWESPLSEDGPSLICVSAGRGFGKSVMMTAALKRLQDLQIREKESKPIVLYFYFKKGDTATESVVKGLESIVSQLLDDKVYIREVNVKNAVSKIIDNVKTKSAESAANATTSNEHAHSDQKKKSTDSATSEKPKPLNNPVTLKTIIEQVGKELDRPIYIVIDAVDESESSTSESDLMKLLKDLTTSKVATVRAIVSTREDFEEIDFEPTAENVNGSNLAVVHVNEEVNSADMEKYLKKELTKLMKRRMRNRGDEAMERERAKIVEIIKEKAKGSFTYAGMVLASIEQPYRSTLHQMLQNLPEGMDALYRKILQALTFEERSLVSLALVRCVWSFGEVTAVEVAEEFKRVYDGELEAPVYEPTDDGTYDVDGEEEGTPTEQYDPANDPEIEDVIYHLRNAGREFLKITKDTNVITIDSSVREWVLHEATEAAIWQKENRPMTDFFTMDDDGNWKLTLPIPAAVGRGKGAALDFQSERDAQLDICIDIFKTLNHQLFQDRYMPYDIPWPEADEEVEENAEADGGVEEETGEEGTAEAKETENVVSEEQLASNEVEENKESAEEAAQSQDVAKMEDGENARNQAEIEPEQPTGIEASPPQESLESTENKEIQQNTAERPTSLIITDGLLVLDSADLIIATNLVASGDSANLAASENKSVIDNEIDASSTLQDEQDNIHNNSEELVEHEEVPIGEGSTLENGETAGENATDEQPAEGEEAPAEGEEVPAEGEGVAEEAAAEEEGPSNEPRRYESEHWIAHLKRVEELWEPSQRQGRKWALLWENIKEFITSIAYAKWRFQLNYTTEMSRTDAIDREITNKCTQPMHTFADAGILMVIEKMVNEWEFEVDIGSRTNQTPLTWATRWPSLVKFFIEKESNVNHSSEDAWTPLLMCVNEGRDAWYKRETPSEEAAFSQYNESGRSLIEAGADITVADSDGWLPLSYATEIKNEVLFDLLIEHEKMTTELIQHPINDKKTPLHLIFSLSDRPEVAYRMAKVLVEKEADVNAQDAYSTAPLARACEAGNIEAVKLLLEHKADVLDDDEWGYTALHVSVVEEKDWAAPIARILLDAGADYGKKSAENATPLTSAVSGGNLESVELILEWCRKGPWIAPILTPQESEVGDHQEAAEEHTDKAITDEISQAVSDVISGITESDDTVPAPTNEVSEPVEHHENVTEPEIILTETSNSTNNTGGNDATATADEAPEPSTETGAETIPPKPYHYVADNLWRGQNLLHICAWRGDPGLPMAKALLAECTDEQIASLINTQQGDDGDDGRTPLYVAAQYYNKDLMAFFIEKGARVHGKSLNGETAIDVITRLWIGEDNTGMDEDEIDRTQADIYEGCLMVLLAHAGDAPEDWKLLQTATSRGNTQILKVLADSGMKPDVADEHGWNTFHFARSYQTENALVELFTDFDRVSLASLPTLAPSKMTGRKHDNMMVSEDGLTVWIETEFEDQAALIIADHPINVDGTHNYFEVYIESAEKNFPSIGIGLVSNQQPTERMPGWRNDPFAQTFGFHGDDGKLFESSNSGRAFYSTHPNADLRYDIGHTVGCGFDVTTNEIFYTHNGDYLGVAFTNVRGRLFPAIGMCQAKVRVNFGEEAGGGEFVYKGERMGEKRRGEMVRRFSEASGRGPGSPRRERKEFVMGSIDDVVA